jgi:DNA mismatch repair ATPase MutS
METDDDNSYNTVINRYEEMGVIINPMSIRTDPTFNEFPDNKEIDIPEKLKDVVKKMCPEIMDIVSVGYRETVMYSPDTFDQIKKYLVGIDLYFDDKYGMKKSKNDYGKELTDYFKMTYGELDFVTFHVRSFIFPPEKTNEEKFFEVFGKTE